MLSLDQADGERYGREGSCMDVVISLSERVAMKSWRSKWSWTRSKGGDDELRR